MRIYDQAANRGKSPRFAELFKEFGARDMGRSQGGDFTRNFLSLQLQLQTLMEGVGGDGTASLLDNLAQLSESERSKIIPLLSRVVGRIAQGDKRLFSDDDRALKDFEDSLFESIVASLGHSANDDQVLPNKRKLEVVAGGKTPASVLAVKKHVKAPSLIDLAKARESRRHRMDTPPNEVS